MTAAIAGIFAMADGSVAQPVNLARGYELNAIAAAVVGGCSLQGGVGTVTGTMLGRLVPAAGDRRGRQAHQSRRRRL